MRVAIERNQPPLFRIAVPQQTPLGIYTVPLIVTIREPSIATLTKSISVNITGVIEVQSKHKLPPNFFIWGLKFPLMGNA